MRALMFALLFATSTLSGAQECRRCNSDIPVQYGYISTICCTGKCACYPGAETIGQPTFRAVNPGILPEQRAGKLVVRYVIEDSPAQRAGVMAGDEIISINGAASGSMACQAGWLDADSNLLVLRRGNRNLRFQVAALPLPSLLAEHSLVLTSSRETHKGFELDAPFTFGLRATEQPARGLTISEVLMGSPADLADIRVGDAIVAINGISTRQGDRSWASLLQDGFEPERVIIEVSGGFVNRAIELRSRGIASILASAPRKLGSHEVLAELR